MNLERLERTPVRTVVTAGPARNTGRGAGFADFVAEALAGLLDRLLLWQQRAGDRAHLASLTDRYLRDVGLTRADVDAEASKPFWLP